MKLGQAWVSWACLSSRLNNTAAEVKNNYLQRNRRPKDRLEGAYKAIHAPLRAQIIFYSSKKMGIDLKPKH
jgi:hypothetical protein